MAPTELTASTTAVKPALRTDSTSTASSASTEAICSSVKSWSSTCPRPSAGAKSKSPLSANSSISFPSAADRNSPSEFSSLRAFHSRGLWLAVMMMPPSVPAKRTASSVVGVDASPHLTTSTPQAASVPHTSCSTMGPLIRASRPTTTLNLPAFGDACLRILSQYAYVNLTMSTGVRLSPQAPPTVPRMPEIDLMSVIGAKL